MILTGYHESSISCFTFPFVYRVYHEKIVKNVTTRCKTFDMNDSFEKCFYDPVKLHQSVAFSNKPTFHPSLRTNDLPPTPQMVNNMFKDMVQKR